MLDRLEHFIEEMAEVCKAAYDSGLQRANGGNVSMRIKNHMLVKTKGTSFRKAGHEDFVLSDFYGMKVEGNGEPTKESLMHGTIYRCCPKVNAVVHVHAPYATAWSANHQKLEQETWQAKLKFAYDLPVVDVESPVVRKEDIPLVEAVLTSEKKTGGFLLKNHGLVAIGENIQQALQTAELIEETAKIASLKHQLKKGR